METNIYFLRHAESNFVPNDDNYRRSLSAKGKEDTEKLIQYFSDINITKVLSSPYHRAVHTVEAIAEDKGFR